MKKVALLIICLFGLSLGLDTDVSLESESILGNSVGSVTIKTAPALATQNDIILQIGPITGPTVGRAGKIILDSGRNGSVSLNGSTYVPTLSVGMAPVDDAIVVSGSIGLYGGGTERIKLDGANGRIDCVSVNASVIVSSNTFGCATPSANGAVATTITSVGPTGAQTTIQGWIPMYINGTKRFMPFW